MDVTYSPIPKELALRYLGWHGNDIPAEIDAQVDSALRQMEAAFSPKTVWRRLALAEKGKPVLRESGLVLPGADLIALLCDCESVVLFALTLGDGAEALIRRAMARSVSQGMIMDACASAACESACDDLQNALESELCKGDLFVTDRYSPGYGDLPLSLQPDFLALLDAGKRIGLTLTESNIMLPRKSVTALFGLADRPQGKRMYGCAKCSLRKTCSFRREGKRCGSKS